VQIYRDFEVTKIICVLLDGTNDLLDCLFGIWDLRSEKLLVDEIDRASSRPLSVLSVVNFINIMQVALAQVDLSCFLWQTA
jgi:hypothetical protein